MRRSISGKLYVFFTSVLILIIHLPFTFASAVVTGVSKDAVKHAAAFSATATKGRTNLFVYDSLKLDIRGLSKQAFDLAVRGLGKLRQAGKIANDEVLSIIDFTKPSSQKRLYVIDMENCKLLFNTYVAHGQHSGENYANSFSNKPESFQSSLGFYETEETYIGKNGYSLHLNGLEKGINDRAEERAIVMHGAPYVSESYIRMRGCLGRSWGCPALPEELNKPIIDKIKDGSCLFIYGADKRYIKHSAILKA